MLKRKFTGDNDESSDEEFQPRPKKERKVHTPDSGSSSRRLKITDLPVDCLLLVFSHINIWHHNRIRGTCKYFREAHDIFVRHEIQRAICEFSKNKNEDDLVAAATLIGIKRGTQVYVNAGYEAIMYECLMPLLRYAYRTPFDIRSQDIKGFLATFYETLDAYMDNSHSHRALMLYMMTLIDILRSFRECHLIASARSRTLYLNIQLPQVWVGTLLKGFVCNQGKSNAILVLLTMLLIANLSAKSSRHIHKFGMQMLVFGCDGISNPVNTKTDLRIHIGGSKRIRSFFEKWATGPSDQDIKLPDNLCAEKFYFNINIASMTWNHWRCPPMKILHIEPRYSGIIKRKNE